MLNYLKHQMVTWFILHSAVLYWLQFVALCDIIEVAGEQMRIVWHKSGGQWTKVDCVTLVRLPVN